MTARRGPAAEGFTLLEILVAVTLLGLLMAALFGGVRLGVRAWEASETRLDDDARLTAVQDFLRDRLTQAHETQESALNSQTQPSFLGEPDRLTFVTLMPEHLGAGFYHMVLALSAATGGTDLALTWWPSEAGGDAGAETAARAPARHAVRSRALLARVAGLHLAYFGAVADDQPPAWSEVWSQPGLPLLVRVQLRFADRDARSWPDLIVRPMIDGQAF